MAHCFGRVRAITPCAVARSVLRRRRTGRLIVGRCLIVRRRLIGLLPLIVRPLILGRSLAIGRCLLIGRRLLIGRPLLVGALRLRAALLHLGASLAHLLVELILLIARQHAHNLLAQRAIRVAIDRTSRRMCLRVLIDERLDSLLLISREIESAQAFHPAMLELRLAGGAVTLRLRRRGRRLSLLRGGTERDRESRG